MKAHLLWLFTVITLILLVGSASANSSAAGTAAPQAAPFGTSFTYQGRLRSSNRPFNGSCDFQFSLWNALQGGASLGGTISKNNTPVSDGRFTVQLDFGAVFDGNDRWLQIAVRCPTGSGAFTTLSPRQAIDPSPYAVRATTASSVPWSGITGKPAGFADDVDNGATVPLNLSGATNVAIISASNTGTGRAGLFENTEPSSAALRADNTGNNGVGLYGQAVGANSISVRGVNTTGYGVWGESNSQPAVLGLMGAGTHNIADAGVVGSSLVANGTGVFGVNNNGSNAYGVWGASSSGYAGFFNGDVHVQGTFTSSDKQFKIDHPLDPANKYLYHASVESSDMKNIYDGVVTLDAQGAATVTLPEWFEALNQDFRYQLTAIGAPGPDLYIAQEIQGNQFVIAGGKPGSKVSWQVTGIRHDAWANQNRMQVEVAKSAQERGKYLYPQGYGQPESKGENYTKQQQLVQSGTQTDGNATTP